MSNQFVKSIWGAGAALGMGLSLPVNAQEATSAEAPAASSEAASSGGESADMAEVIVTARRFEERLQDVPISITVFNQQQLADRNVVNASDLATYTPSLSANQRFGSDNTSFAIRGFTQELRTSSSVATYFADVVAPRGGGSVTAGEGAGPGAFFDLQNVQVLKGPQGTLFGRNTTGGAVLLVPQKPGKAYEGYAEQSFGNYDLVRTQAVANLPFTDAVRLRLGADYQNRDGVLKNTSGTGPERLGDVAYLAARASLVLDLAANLENYTIASYSRSDNSGGLPQVFACNTAIPVFGQMSCEQLARQGSDFHSVQNPESDPRSYIRQWQAINTTTWNVNDNLTVKNIASYAQLKTIYRTGVFGTNFFMPSVLQNVPVAPGVAVNIPTGPLAGTPITFVNSDQATGVPTTDQSTLSEELQFQGRSEDQKLVWQAGLYFERSKPEGISGSQSIYRLNCSDAANLQCIDPLGMIFRRPAGLVQKQLGNIEYRNEAVYAQGTYALTEQFKLTGGLRYTRDHTQGDSQMWSYTFYPNPSSPTESCVNPSSSLANGCAKSLKKDSKAPTWLIDLDYKPNQDVLLYAKYARGYRQGSVNIFGADGYDSFDPEKVDTYEVGSKLSFKVPFPGSFNIAAFYNDFRDQQLQVNFTSTTGGAVPSTGIVNAGKSRIQGVEVETMIMPLKGVTLSVSYTYLDTELKSLDPVSAVAPYDLAQVQAAKGGPLTFSPKNKMSLTAAYRFPLADRLGRLEAAASYIYTDEQLSSSASPLGTLPSFELLNLNLNWGAVGGSPVDLALFATNVLDKEYATYISGLYNNGGFESRQLGEPRMFGGRLRYNFGS